MTYARLDTGAARAIADALAGRVAGIAVDTSGSTGRPREVLVSGEAIRAGVSLSSRRLGGDAHQLLALPPERIGGALVIARATVAGTALVRMPMGPFTAAGFAAAARSLPSGPRQVSLVPTQVRRLLADPEGRDALAGFHAVLVGGAALPERDAPSNIVRTYGMSETAGGCVYDGLALDGVGLRIADDGRVMISGPTLADGYADGHGADFVEIDGERWFRTSDLGELHDGRLTVHGRADHVINTGGVKVHPQRIELALERAGAAAAAVVGLPDPEWGERVVAVVEDGPDDAALAAAVADLPPYARPRRIVHVDAVPRTAGGKIDRPAARALASEEDR
ncbi:AMP-binding protein [Demequina mangrovi]|uniref:O-succinylbenzoic acid--CoA ligase n=1 Tax=Demequina mangrovi TaxID=1043493 RepID=A0A1H6WLA3_9MICO|nr:AMP-binding protein [Demequina mangrovi]SEJ13570.1 O-succinylbenzoic acid--CoA ligase [Demequina mangrovi]